MLEILDLEEPLDYDNLDYSLRLWFNLCCFLKHPDNEQFKLVEIAYLFAEVDKKIAKLDFKEIVNFLSASMKVPFYSLESDSPTYSITGQREQFLATSNFMDYVILAIPDEHKSLLNRKRLKNFNCENGCFS